MKVAYQKLDKLQSIREKLDNVLQADLREVGYDPQKAELVLEQALE